MPVQLTTPWRRDDRRGGDEETDGLPRRTYEASLDLDHQLDDARRAPILADGAVGIP